MSTIASSSRGTSGLSEDGGGAFSRTCWYATATGESPVNGGVPVSSSNSSTPVEYTSERASTFSPRACSGDRYCAVPITAAVWVTVAALSATARAMPKSITLTAPARVIMTFPGFTSRCTMPLRWEKSSAAQTSATISIARRGISRPSALSTSRRVRPSTYSMTMYGWEPLWPMTSSPVSYTATIAGWFSEAAACASRRNRAWNDGSRARSARSTLTATSLPSRTSRPRCTSAIPP